MSNKNFNTNTKNNDEWLTPRFITDELGPFDLDPCSPICRPWNTAKNHYSLKDGDGLLLPWKGSIWLNPPYGKMTGLWLKKLSEHKEGGVALVFTRTETKYYFENVWNKADAIFFFKGRLKFCYVDGNSSDCANAPSCLIFYGKQHIKRLDNFSAKGKIVYL